MLFTFNFIFADNLFRLIKLYLSFLDAIWLYSYIIPEFTSVLMAYSKDGVFLL